MALQKKSGQMIVPDWAARLKLIGVDNPPLVVNHGRAPRVHVIL
jgi:hypothetical protein